MAPRISPRGAQVITWAYVMFALAAIVVVARIMVRTMMIRVVGREDLAIIIALISSLLESILMHLQVTKGGLGQHFDSLTPPQIVQFSKMAYFTIIAYNVSLCATKFSILFLCFRIFDVARWRKVYFSVLVVLGGYTIWVAIDSVMPCVPIRAQWDASVSGWCFPPFTMWLLNASLNIFTDVLVVTLPIPVIMTLQLPRKQKIGVGVIFALGFFVCIVSILRIPSIFKAGKTKDPTYENCGIAIWSIVEVNVAIIGACLSTLKPLFVRVWPRLLLSIHTKSRSYHRHSQGVHRTITEMHDKNTKNDALAEPYPDYSSATSVLRGEDDVALRDMEGNALGVRIERADDERSEETRERSMDGWYRPGEKL